MTEILHKQITPNNYFSPRTFGGVINPSDYNTDYRGKDSKHGSQIAKRIISDQNFDYRCKINIDRNRNMKSGGLQNA